MLARSGTSTRLLAAPVADIIKSGGPGLHEILLGEAPLLEELAARLWRAGLPLVAADGGTVDITEGAPWWRDTRFDGTPHFSDMVRLLWPNVLDDKRVEPPLQLPVSMAESVNGSNIINFYGFYLVVPQSLGPVDLNKASDRHRPEIRAARTLIEAQTLAATG